MVFIFFINGSNVQNEYSFSILNQYNKIIYTGKTKSNRINYNFKKNNLYKIKITNNLYGINKLIPYYCKNNNEIIYYNIQIPHIVKLKLIDNYYENLPIEKGNIIIWPNT